MKKYIIFLLLGNTITAQVGINTKLPNSTLAVNGSLRTSYNEIKTPKYNILDTDYYLTYNGDKNADFTLPKIGTGNNSFAGRIYKIKNISPKFIILNAADENSLREDITPEKSILIPSGAYAEIVNNNNDKGATWDVTLTYKAKTNLEIYGTVLKIPPHASNTYNEQVPDWENHRNTNFDSGKSNDTWHIISKKSSNCSINSNYAQPSKMTLIYEYQGEPFDINNMYPMITTGNNTNHPDVFAASFIKLANDGTNGKTRLTVTVVRLDLIGNKSGQTADWAGTFLMNVLLIKKLKILV